MNYVIVSGSHRKESQSSKVSHYLAEQIPSIEPGSSVQILDLAGNPFPLWDESIWESDPKWMALLKPYQEMLRKADGLVIVTPEWNGMVPAGLKNFFLVFSARELGNKPALIVSVSSSRGGTYPVAELRMSSYKNTRICYIPEHIIIRDVEKMLNPGNPPFSEDDGYIRKRIAFCLKVLAQYTQALKGPRESGALFSKEFPNGM